MKTNWNAQRLRLILIILTTWRPSAGSRPRFSRCFSSVFYSGHFREHRHRSLLFFPEINQNCSLLPNDEVQLLCSPRLSRWSRRKQSRRMLPWLLSAVAQTQGNNLTTATFFCTNIRQRMIYFSNVFLFVTMYSILALKTKLKWATLNINLCFIYKLYLQCKKTAQIL